MDYRNNASYGKRQEFIAMATLLEKGFDVYPALVDDMGIDCIVRINSKRYVDIQIKARSNKTKTLRQRAYFPQIAIVEPRENYLFMLYSEYLDSYWIIPSLDIIEMAFIGNCHVSKMKTGKNIDSYSISIVNSNGDPYPLFDKYKNKNGFKFLIDAQ